MPTGPISTAVSFVQLDSIINRKNEDRFQVSGLGFGNRPPIGPAAQREAGKKILTDLIDGWYPVNNRPCVENVFINRHFADRGGLSLPQMTFVFADSNVATQIRFKLLSHIRSSDSPALRRVWIEPVLTRATLVRVEILLAIKRALSASVERCMVQGRGHSPQLQVVSGRRERFYGFVESCELFGHLLTADSLQGAYKSAARLFHNRLAATFLVLVDGAQPVANFFVPAPRPVLPAPTAVAPVAGAPVAGAELGLPIVAVRPVSPNYLQRILLAPVPSGSGSGSGRKRPADVLVSQPKR
jgi:hypothetical protein